MKIPVFYLYKIGHRWWYGGTQSVKTLFRGYAKNLNDLGVRKYQKVENPWSKLIIFFNCISESLTFE
jgi:hypothetical protein